MKFFVFLIFLLMSINNSAAQTASFNCVHKQHFYTYQFFIDLNNMIMKLGPFLPYKISRIDEDTIYASSHSDGMERYMIFKRYSGEVTYSLIYKDSKKILETATYKCKKSSKIF